jgi:hypothetical protein
MNICVRTAVLFCRVSHAAKAFEGCDRSYKAVFAEPKKQKNPYDIYDRFSGPPSTVTSFDSPLSPFSSSMYYAKVLVQELGYQRRFHLYVLMVEHLILIIFR